MEGEGCWEWLAQSGEIMSWQRLIEGKRIYYEVGRMVCERRGDKSLARRGGWNGWMGRWLAGWMDGWMWMNIDGLVV